MSDVVKKIEEKNGGWQLLFYCPACKETHAINHSWDFNGNFEKPSISPSIRVEGYNETLGEYVCHTWITNGRIKFFGDSTHHMAGKQWIDMIPLTSELINKP